MFGWLKRDDVDRSGGSGDNVRDGDSQHLALYKFDGCPYCQRVYRTIDSRAVNIEYRDVRTNADWRRDLIERTGRSQVPCLLIDGEPLFESADISAFVEANYAAAQ